MVSESMAHARRPRGGMARGQGGLKRDALGFGLAMVGWHCGCLDYLLRHVNHAVARSRL